MKYSPFSYENYTSVLREKDGKGEGSKNTIEVNGLGIVRTAPDIAMVSIGVVTEGKELEKVQRENAAIMQRVINSIRNLGIPEEDIQTQSYNIEIIYDYQEGKQIFKGYRVTNILRITIKEVQKTGIVIDTAVSSGANFIGSIEFTLSDKSKFYRRALVKAIADATEKAEVMARTVGAILNRMPLRIEEQVYEQVPRSMVQEAKAMAMDSTPILSGQIQVTAKIKAIFEYK
jgi:uncharacterized protein